jgi:hypothetical protein
MTQIKQEPCDYDETGDSKQVVTCIEFNDPLDIKDSGTIVFTSKIVFSINEQLTIVFRAVDNCLHKH